MPGSPSSILIDALQYSNWSEKIFRQMNDGGVSAVHVTICYHEDFRETVENISEWNRRFERHPDLIVPGHSVDDVRHAHEAGKTAIVFGCQNCSPLEDDVGLVEICHQLGIRFMQLTYNNQSLLATGCYEATDSGVTRMGKQVIREMNRVGMVVDMSHSAEQSTLNAIDISKRPIAITHANPSFWHPALRNKPNDVLNALSQSNGIIGFSLYPHHLNNGSNCTLEDFCQMVAGAVDIMGIEHVGIGSDLCQDQPDTIVEWMRNGTWTRERDFGEGSAGNAGFPKQPDWFETNLGFSNIAGGLSSVGFSDSEVALIMGGNWLDFFERSFGPEVA